MNTTSCRCAAGLPLLVRHVAERLSVPERTIRYWAKTGRLPARRVSLKIWAFDEADVEKLRMRRVFEREH